MKILSVLTPVLLVSFLVGVVGGSLLPVIPLLLFLSLSACVATLLLIVFRSHRIALCAVVGIGLLLGAGRMFVVVNAPYDPMLRSHVGQQVSLSGVVIDEPDVREQNTHLTIHLTYVHDPVMTPVSETVLVFVPRYPEFAYGDVVKFQGILTVPEKFETSDERTFDYPAYLRAKGITYQMFYPTISKTDIGKGNKLKAGLFAIKRSFQKAIGDALPEPESSLLGGLLLGGKQSLGEEWLTRFKTAGIVHIVVLSGYNMTIVAEWLVVLFRFLGFVGSLSVGALGIVAFAVMTGGGATVVRAAIMALLVLLARATGRTSEMGRALLIAGAVMVALNPLIITSDPSFQLSFLASLGLVYVSPVLARWVKLWVKHTFLHEVLISTLATQIMVLPLLLYQTGLLSIISLPTNILVLPVIPFTMLFGFVGGLIALVAPPLSVIAGFPAHLLLSYILHIAAYAALVPFASISMPLSVGGVAMLYALLCLFLWSKIGKPSHVDPVPPLPRSHEELPEN